jgi:predicted AAA+ superfamily ATPase
MINTDGNYSFREAASLNPKLALDGQPPVAIDEWQEVPAIWDAVRQRVDAVPEKGMFLLTGSVTKKNPKNRPVHSGAGRIARVKMRPMTLFESGDSDGSISLAELFEDVDFEANAKPIDIENLIHLTIRGGWPANLETPEPDAGLIPRQYIELLATADISLSDDTPRDSAKVRLLLQSLARNISTTVSNASLQRDIQNGANSLSMPTIISYIDSFRRLYVLEEIPGWKPPIRTKARIQQSPKRIFADPSLAVAALKASPKKLLTEMSAFGYIFESLCLRDLTTYAESINGEIFHYTDNSNLEIDAIIETEDGSYGAFEVKLNPERIPEALSALKRFKEKMKAAKYAPPKCLAIITGGGVVQRREDGVYIIPITALRN